MGAREIVVIFFWHAKLLKEKRNEVEELDLQIQSHNDDLIFNIYF